MKTVKFIIKFTLFLIATILIVSGAFLILLALFPLRHQAGPVLLQFYSRVSLAIFQVKIERADPLPVSKQNDRGVLLISNHSSFLDIFLLGALYKTVYLSKRAVMYYPIVGQAAWLAGIVFLRRSSKEDRSKVIRTIAHEALGRIITIFAQGTTSRIEDDLPFRCGIFKTVELNKEIILVPVSIHYKEDAHIAWTNGQNLFDNVSKVCALGRIHVKVYTKEAISYDDYGDKSISEVCYMTEERVRESFEDGY